MDLITQRRESDRRFDQELREAFGFLEDDYNYRSEPVTWGGSPYRVFTKCYSLGGRCIIYSGDFDREHYLELDFYPVDMVAAMDRNPALIYGCTVDWTLDRVIEAKGLRSLFPDDRRDFLGKPSDFGYILEKYCLDLVEGDFSLFPPLHFDVQQFVMNKGRFDLGTDDTLVEAEACALDAAAIPPTSRFDSTTIFVRSGRTHVQALTAVAEPDESLAWSTNPR